MMTATGIVAFFSFLSACSQGVSTDGLLAMLCVMRCVFIPSPIHSILTTYSDSSSALALALSTHAARCQRPSSQKAAPSQRAPSIDGSRSPRVRNTPLCCRPCTHPRADSMIDFGFVIGAFVPLVLYWMCVICENRQDTRSPVPSASATITSAPLGEDRWRSVPSPLSSSSSGV